MEEMGEMMEPSFMGLPITPRFAEALGMAQETPSEEVVAPKAEEPAPEPPSPPPEPVVDTSVTDGLLEKINSLEATLKELTAKKETPVDKPREEDKLSPALERLTAMIETMNKPKTVLRDKDGKIVGVA
jgi:hypothetical protein